MLMAKSEVLFMVWSLNTVNYFFGGIKPKEEVLIGMHSGLQKVN